MNEQPIQHQNPGYPHAPTAPGHSGPPVGAPDYRPTPEPTNEYSGFSIAAVVMLVGAALTLIGYPLVWLVVRGHEAATVTGLGKITNTADGHIVYESSRIHWLAGIAAIGLIVFAVLRLLGRFGAGSKRIPIVLGALGAAGAVLSYLSIDEDFKAGTGLYLTLIGSIIGLAGAVLMVVAKK